MKIFYLKGLKVSQFNKYAKHIKALSISTNPRDISSELPGAKPERLTSPIGIDLYSVRVDRCARLIYTIIKDPPYKGHIVLCGAADDHNYDAVLRNLRKRKGDLQVFLLSQDDIVDDLTDDEAAAAAAPVEYAEMHFYGEHFIELNTSQIKVLQTSLPAIIHGAPGTGKTLIGANLAKNYLQNPSIKQDETPPLRALFLFPTKKLADETQKTYLESCEFDGITRDDANLVEFSTYEAFFKDRTREGLLVPAGTSTGFDHFKPWYQKLSPHKKDQLKIKSEKLDAEDCWAAFRICSLYSDVKRYEALSETQCTVPKNLRKAVHELYSNYKEVCEQGHNYSVWTHPFSCEEQFGLVVLDESHNQSGCTISSAYNLSQNGQFVALVGDHQKIGAHQSQLGGGCAAADLLAILVYEDSAQQGRQIKFKTHMLNQTHRNSETVVDVVNFFVGLKLRLGLSTAIKGADCHLNGHNGELGTAQLIIAETDKPRLSALREEYEGRPDVAILVPASRLTEAKKCWRQNLVFSAVDAMGLEFPYVICDGLLDDKQGSMAVGRLLQNPPMKAATAGHRGKQAADPDALQQERWFNTLITACSRAQKAVYFIEEKIPQHTAAILYQELAEVCHQRAGKTETQTQAQQAAPVFTEAWLTQALTLLKENTPQMDAEAKRMMDANLDHGCDAYLQFLAQYTKNQQQRAESASKATPPQLNLSAMTTKATTTPIPSPAKRAPKTAYVTEARPASSTVEKGSQPSSAKTAKPTRESACLALLVIQFTGENLLKALDECDDVIRLFAQDKNKKEDLLTVCFNNEEHRKIFARCCIIKPKLLEIVLNPQLQMQKRVRSLPIKKETVNILFQRLSDIYKLYMQNESGIGFPAHLAAEYGDIPTLTFLFSLGVDLISAVNTNSSTPADFAAAHGRVGVLEYLHSIGADFMQTNQNGTKPAIVAAAQGQVEVLMYLHSIRVDLMQPDQDGNTPAIVAAAQGQVEVLMYLHSIRVDLMQPDQDGNTPAIVAAANGKVEVLMYLKSIGVDFNRADSDGATPAQYAAVHGQVKVLEYLHSIGADLNKADNDGRTCISLAVLKSHLNVVEYLLKFNQDNQDSYTSTEDDIITLASRRDDDVKERACQKIAARRSVEDPATKVQLSLLDIAEIIGDKDIVAILKEYAASKVSAAALVAPNGSMFNSGSHQASAVVDDPTKKATHKF